MAEESVGALLRRVAQNQQEAEKDRRAMFQEVGRAIVMLSDIESLLADLFVILSQHIDEDQAENLFYSTQSLDLRLRLADYAVASALSKEKLKRWLELSQRIRKHKLVRNVAAHSYTHFELERDKKRWRIVLKNPKRNGKDLGITDVQKSADELEKLLFSVRKFLIRAADELSGDKGNEES